MTEDLAEKNQELEKACRKKEKIEEEIKEKKKEYGKMQIEFSNIRESVSIL